MLQVNHPHIRIKLINETNTKQTGRKYTTTTLGMKLRTRIGFWNIRTLLEPSRLAQVHREMIHYKISILGLSEVRWSDSGEHSMSDGSVFLYSGKPAGEARANGVGILLDKNTRMGLITWNPISDRLISVRLKTKVRNFSIVQCYAPTEAARDEDKDAFYEQLHSVVRAIPKGDVIFLSGDLNAKIGADNAGYEDIMGKHAPGHMNDNGERFLEFCRAYDLIVGGSLFPHRDCHKVTWVSPDSRTQNQIDHMAISKMWRGSLLDVRNRRGADVHSDHHLVLAEMRMKVASTKSVHAKASRKFNISRLADKTTHLQFKEALNRRYMDLDHQADFDLDTTWNRLKEVYVTTCEETLGYRETNSRKEWISDVTWDTIQVRRSIKGMLNKATTTAERQHLGAQMKLQDNLVKKSARRDKRAWAQDLAEQAQIASDCHNTRALYQVTRKLANKSLSGEHPIKSKDGEILATEDAQINRWREHFQEVLNTRTNANFVTDENITPPLKMNTNAPSKAEIKLAIKKLKNGKAAGSDGLPAEIFKADPETSSDILHKMITSIWQTEDAPTEWKEGVIIKLHKKGDKKDCNNYRGLTLLNTASKVLTLILLRRLTDSLEPTIRNEQAGFRPRKSCVDQINTLRIIIEQSAEWRSPLYLLFVDFEKAFDTVDRNVIWEVLKHNGVPQKIINVTRSLYLNATCRIKHRGKLSERFSVTSGVKQGCALSPLLFILVIDYIMKAVNQQPRGIRWNLYTRLEDLDYADDLCLLSHTYNEMQAKLDLLEHNAANTGLKINIRKTQEMRMGGRSIQPLTLNNTAVETTVKFCYLGSVLTPEGGAIEDVTARIRKAGHAFGLLKIFWNSPHIKRRTKINVFNSSVKSILLYACETWKVTTAITARIQTFVNKCLRRILKIHWPEVITNITLWRLTNQEPVAQEIMKRKWKWIGHTLRKPNNDITREALEWNPQGQRRAGRPRTTWKRTVENEARKRGKSWNEVKCLAPNRTRWRCFVEALCSS